MEGATTVLHISSTGFFSRNQLELEARPALYQRPRNCNQWMSRLAMLHAPPHEQWASCSSSRLPHYTGPSSTPFLGLHSSMPPSLAGLVHCPMEEVSSKDPPLFPRMLRPLSLSQSSSRSPRR